MFSFAAKKAIWFFRDKHLQCAFETTVDNKDHFHQLEHFEDVQSHFSSVMFFEHVPAAVLDLLNSLQYIPLFILIHAGASDFSKYNNLKQKINIKNMMHHVNRLVKAVDTHHSDGFKGVFYSLVVSVPWYPGWQQQKMARRARVRLNDALAKHSKLAGAYIIGHDGIQAKKGEELYDTQDLVNLSNMGNHMLMADILICVEKILLPFHTVYKASQVHKAKYNAFQGKDLKLWMKKLSLH